MIMFVVRLIYNLFFLLLLPFLFLRLLWRSFRAPTYRKRWLERLGIFVAPAQQGGIWLHTVSVGEFMAALPMIRDLQEQYPHELITITTTTPTGSERVLVNLKDSVFHVYLPYDFAFGINSFLTKIQPKMCIILETELWLNLLHCCKVRKIPVLIANGCLSPNSLKGYMRVRFVISKMLNMITKVMAKSSLDGDRFLQLGLRADKLSIPGNIKYDMPIQEQHINLGKEFIKTWGTRLVLIAASTHDGEEQQILEAFGMVKKQIPDFLLVLVPRHPERFNMVAELVQSYGFTMLKRSIGQVCSPATEVFLVDTMGELGIFYQIADIAFVGGSLVPVGGHNALEAAAAGIPVIMGPYLHKCTEVIQAMLVARAMVIIKDTTSLAEVLLNWIHSDVTRKEIGANAKAVFMQNQGATSKILEIIKETWNT
jgi:3-deoxy-D-manno-octulosonic-acid transferase